MNTICLCCGSLLQIEPSQEAQCLSCGFMNKIDEEKSPPSSLMMMDMMLKKPKKKQFCYPPFTEKQLDHVGDKQKKAILKYLNKEELEKRDYDLVFKMSMAGEWERVRDQKDKYDSQLQIYDFFNKFFKNTRDFKKEVEDLYKNVVKTTTRYNLKEISKPLLVEKMTSFKKEFISLIEKYPYLFKKEGSQFKSVAELWGDEWDKQVYEGEFFYTFLSFIEKKGGNAILSQLKIIEEKIMSSLEN